MEYVEKYALDALLVAMVLAIFGLAGLIYTARRVRPAVLGDLLLEACAGDYQTAVLAIENVKAENALLAETIARRDIPRTSETRH